MKNLNTLSATILAASVLAFSAPAFAETPPTAENTDVETVAQSVFDAQQNRLEARATSTIDTMIADRMRGPGRRNARPSAPAHAATGEFLILVNQTTSNRLR